MDMEGKTCGNCKHCHEPIMSNCSDCETPELKGWEPAGPQDFVYRGLDMGAPEGDKTNVRLDWGERGPELIVPEGITSVDKLKDGPLLETARDVVKKITRLDYAIEGVRSKMSSIGIKLTDKTLSRDELTLLVCQLNELQLDLYELEDEREALRKAGQVPKP